MKRLLLISKTFFVLGAFTLASCGDGNPAPAQDPSSYSSDPTTETKAEETTASDEYNMGIGPVTEKLELGAIDDVLAKTGKEIFDSKCTACHKMDARHVGPAMAGITERRNPEWVMNMILNPDEMTKKDPIAYDLIAEYIAPMANQSLTLDESRALLEYFRQYDSK